MKKDRRKKTRQGKIDKGLPHEANNKFTSELGIKDAHLTVSQNELYKKIQNNTIIFVEAPAGTGKSYAALYYAVQNYLANRDDIVVIRTPLEAGLDKVGFLPAGLSDKLEPHFASARMILDSLLSKGKVENELDKKIFFKIPNFCLGCTFTNSVILIDEAQTLSPMIMKLLLERIGDNTKVIVCGDSTQVYTNSNGRNGLTSAMERFFETSNGKLIRDPIDKNLTPSFKNVCYHRFGIEDVVRSEIVKSVLTAYSNKPL